MSEISEEVQPKTEFEIANNAAYEWVKSQRLESGIGTGKRVIRDFAQQEIALLTWGFTAGARWQKSRRNHE